MTKPKIILSVVDSKHEPIKELRLEGYTFCKYKVGENFRMVNKNDELIFTTTPIIEIEGCFFKTANSSYRIDVIEPNLSN